MECLPGMEHMPVLPAAWDAEAEGHKFKASLGNLIRPCLKKKEKKETEWNAS